MDRILGIQLNPVERQISIRLSAALLKEISRRARMAHRRRSDVVREALQAAVGGHNGGRAGLWIDRVRDLLGSVRGTPPDLASHPRKYMNRFGHARR